MIDIKPAAVIPHSNCERTLSYNRQFDCYFFSPNPSVPF